MPLSVLIWTDNVLLWLWTAIGVTMLAPAAGRTVRAYLGNPDPARRALLAGVLSAIAFGLGTWSVAPQHPDGDEPHYLIITQSILQDRDLKIENNHRQRDYEAYMNRSIRPDFLKRGTDGQIYSIHAPGLPLLVAPGFALFGYRGVLIELVLLECGRQRARLAHRVATDWRRGGELVRLGGSLRCPSHSSFMHRRLFPDGLGAMLTLVAVLPLVDARAREPRPLFIVGAALAVLPWLSSRFIALAGMAAVVIALRLIAQQSGRAAPGGAARCAVARLASFAICPVVSAVAFFGVLPGHLRHAKPVGGLRRSAQHESDGRHPRARCTRAVL